jgi:hypothetical protein
MFFLLADNLPGDPLTKWLLVCAGVLTLVYAVMRPGFRRKKDPLAKSLPSSLAQQRAVEREMTSLLVELSEMARQISAQLDTRALKLELLIKEADEKIARLQGGTPPQDPAIVAAAETALAAAAKPSSAPSPRSHERESPATESRYQSIYELADRGAGAGEIAQQLDRPRGEIELILALRAKTASLRGGEEGSQPSI